MNKKIAVLPGDGIGPEVVAQGLKVLNTIAKKFDHNFQIKNYDLTVALHYVYNTPIDKLIWDVGHQAYPREHKNKQ